LAGFEALGSEPRPIAGRQLTGSENLRRVRVLEYRVFYAVDNHTKLIDEIVYAAGATPIVDAEKRKTTILSF
jgi:mRNA-degrading endonuclease RelE of RelBE toxin-antitoxin system